MNNIVGKMLIVLQLVFCILFMCFAGAVYSFSGAWRNQANDLESKLTVANKATEDANAARDRETKQLQALLNAAEQERDVVKSQLQNAQTRAAENQKRLAQSEQERDKALTDAEIASSEASDRVAESAVLNKEVQSLRNRVNELTQRNRDTEDALLDRTGKLASAEEREEDLLSSVARLQDLLRINDIEPNSFPTGAVAGEVPKVDGFVQRSKKNSAGTQELVLITIGGDDKVRKGMMMTVFRGDDYLCRARVMEVYPDEAICVVDEKTRARNGSIERGDNVTTKL